MNLTEEAKKKCPDCKGLGVIFKRMNFGYDPYWSDKEYVRIKCPKCCGVREVK